MVRILTKTLVALLLFTAPSFATTWYVRDGGGTPTQCTGTTNAVYPGSGSGVACAYNHPAWLIGGLGQSEVLAAGDTMWIVGDSDNTWNFTVSGVTTLPIPGDTYTTGGNTYTVTVSLPVGATSGNIAMTGTATPANTGTLTRTAGSGTTPITYTAKSVAQAQFMIGWGMPNTNSGQCGQSFAYACNMNDITSGTSQSQPTSIKGLVGADGIIPQLWATEGLGYVLDWEGNNYDFENVEVTQHSSCSNVVSGYNPGSGIYPGGCGGTDGNYPYGPSVAAATWGKVGVQYEGSNLTTKNIYVHGMGNDDIYFTGNLQNWNSTNDRYVAGASFLDDGGTMTFSGNNTQTNDVWAFGGCANKYPQPDPGNVKDLSNYLNCCDQGVESGQSQSGNCLGGGFMMQNDGNASCGNWNVSGDQFLFNLKTNWDFLHCDGTGSINITRSISEGSSGEALKLNIGSIQIENSFIIGNAPVWDTTPFQNIKAPYDNGGGTWSYLVCRGQAIFIIATNNNETVNMLNNTITGDCTALFETGNLGATSPQCAGMSINTWNNNIIAGYDPTKNIYVDLLYNGGTDGDGAGICGTGFLSLKMHNDNVYNIPDSSDCSGTGVKCNTDPLVIGEQSSNLSNILGPTAYYSGTSLGNQLYLQSSSPLRNAGTTSESFTEGSTDFNGATQNTPNPDVGAVQYSTCTPNTSGATTGFCSLSSQCCSTTCNSEQFCSGTCTANSGSCSVGGTCCSGICVSGECSSCLSNGTSTPAAGDCCSGLASGGLCVASVCGDNIIEGSETCDGSALNGQTCQGLGFAGGGTLACNNTCNGYNTSGCSSTVNFPTTGILDTFNRANSTGLGSNWTADTNGTTTFNIVSDTAQPAAGSGANARVYWNQTSFAETQEAYVTISGLGTNADDAKIYARLAPSTGNSYKLYATPGSSTLTLTNQESGATLGTWTQAIANGDGMGMQLTGAVISVYYRHSGTWALIATVTDSSPITTGGNIEIGSDTGSAGAANIAFTNFGGGNSVTCTANSGSCSTGSTCCSGFCNSGSCVAYVCGDGLVTSPEVCDTNGPNLNGQSCTTVGGGFTGGTLGCNSGCLSYNTSGCTTGGSSTITASGVKMSGIIYK